MPSCILSFPSFPADIAALSRTAAQQLAAQTAAAKMPRPKNVLTQMFPPKPAFTDKDVGDLTGKVYIVTGGSSGVGRELARILYAKGATVFIAVRSEPNAEEAMAAIRAAHAQSAGKLEFLSLDLADLEAVAAAAQAFLARADRLDVLFNNAGVMHPPAGSKTKQGHELQLGVHNLGPVLLTELLTPLLARTAAAAPAGSVRVVWVASLYADLSAPARRLRARQHRLRQGRQGQVLQVQRQQGRQLLPGHRVRPPPRRHGHPQRREFVRASLRPPGSPADWPSAQTPATSRRTSSATTAPC